MSPARTPTIGLVVVNYNSHSLVERALAFLDEGDGRVLPVVVDNYSTPAERSAVTQLATERGWHLVAVASNSGFGAGVNRGVEEARRLGCEVFLLLNPDAIISLEVVSELAEHVALHPMTLVSPRVERGDGSTWFAGGDLDLRTGRTTTVRRGRPRSGVPWLSGACLVVHADLWARVGGFEESMFLYWEDVELSFRCQLVGGALMVREDLVAVHDVGGTQSGDEKSELYYFWNSRNRLAFAALHLSRRQRCRWLATTPTYTWYLLRRGRGRRRVLTEPRSVVAALRGVLSGMVFVVVRSRPHHRPAAQQQPGWSG